MSKKPIVGVFALQGCVTPHRFHLETLGVHYKEVRTSEDLASIDALILPGGESTTMLKLIKEFDLEKDLIDTFRRVPVWGICAGAILMARTVLSPAQRSFGLLDMTVQRNAYGSQLQSFNDTIADSPASFIRAPIIQSVGEHVCVHAIVQNTPVWVECGAYMATTFHPELSNTNASNIHKYFIKKVNKII